RLLNSNSRSPNIIDLLQLCCLTPRQCTLLRSNNKIPLRDFISREEECSQSPIRACNLHVLFLRPIPHAFHRVKTQLNKAKTNILGNWVELKSVILCKQSHS